MRSMRDIPSTRGNMTVRNLDGKHHLRHTDPDTDTDTDTDADRDRDRDTDADTDTDTDTSSTR